MKLPNTRIRNIDIHQKIKNKKRLNDSKLRFAVMGATVILITLISIVFLTWHSYQSILRVINIQESATVTHNGKSRLLKINDQLPENSVVTTGKNGKIQLSYLDDNTELTLSGRAEFDKIDPIGVKKIHLYEGDINANVKSNQAALRITTQDSELYTERGEFKIKYDNKTEVEVVNGSIQLKDINNEFKKITSNAPYNTNNSKNDFFEYKPYNLRKLDPQLTGWPLTENEIEFIKKPEHERRPGSEANKYLPAMWPITPAAGFLSNGAWVTIHKKLLDHQNSHTEHLNIVILGDDIAQGWGGTYDGIPFKKSWTDLFFKYKAINLGVAGDKIQNILWRLEHGALNGMTPEIIVINIGYNNLYFIPETGIAPVVQGYQLLIKYLKLHFEESKIVFIKLIPTNDKEHPFFNDALKINIELNDINSDNDPQIIVCDLWNDFLDNKGHVNKRLYQTNNFRLNDAGYELLGGKIFEIISPLLNEKKEKRIMDSKSTYSTIAGNYLYRWYKFNESSGNIAHDSSGYGGDGSMNGSLDFTTASVTGKIGSALSFDGVDDHILVGDIDRSSDKTLSICLWMNTSIALQPGAQNNGYMVTKALYASRTPYSMSVSSANTYQGALPGATTHAGVLNDGQWHHCVMVISGNTRTNYLDGAFMNTESGTLVTNNIQTAIGSSAEKPTYRPFSGNIDDVRFYSKALDATEVLKIYQEAK
jgi:platelet-activating factor acetylhydrolase IB subunit beta/gamma